MTIATSTPTGEEHTHVADEPAEFDAAEAFYKNLTGKSEAAASTEASSGEPESEEKEAPAEGSETEPAAEPEPPTETAEEAAARRQAADEDEVVVQVGDEAKRVSVKDLKRLFGQEASLTRKSQEVSAQRAAVDAEAQKYAAGLDQMAKEAAASWGEYQKIDYLLAKDAMEPAQFAQLRADAQKAFERHSFFAKEVQNFQQTMQQRQQAAFNEAVQAARAAVTDPTNPAHIKDFSDASHGETLEFLSKELGAHVDAMRTITAPWAIKALHMAAQQAKGAKAAASVPRVAKPAVKANAGAPVANKEAPSGSTAAVTAREAMNKLRQTGDIDDAAAAFLASWAK